jgi:hypothetical protein
MTIISIQNVLEKCHNKKFLHDKAFSHPLYGRDVKFCRRIRQEPNKNKILCGQGILGWKKSFLQYKGASVELKRAKTPVNQVFQSPTRQPPPTAVATELRPKGQNCYFSLHS